MATMMTTNDDDDNDMYYNDIIKIRNYAAKSCKNE